MSIERYYDFCPLSIILKYNVKNDSFEMSSDIKGEKITEILSDWIRGQFGLGVDESKPNDKEIYTIIIKLDLEDDTFTTESDTGNKSLTCGIVAHFLEKKGE